MAGLADPQSGSVRIAGTDIHALHGARRDTFRGRHVGLIFQTFHLLTGFSARENVLVAMMASERPRADHDAHARRLLDELGIDTPDARPDELSVGQQQRVAVARAVACTPAVVLADEPTASLDPDNARTAIRLIMDSCAREGAALICTSHDPALREHFDAVIELTDLFATSSTAASTS